MSCASKLRSAVREMLVIHPAFPGELEIFARKEKDVADDLEAALAKLGICLYVMPPLPQRILDGADFIFFEQAEMVVRVIESPLFNVASMDAYDLIEEVCRCLHWQNPDALLAHPMQLAPTPVVIQEHESLRIFDVVFSLQYQL